MIEVLKQWAEDVSKVYDILAFGHTERALEILAKTRTSLRQAIAELESQEPRNVRERWNVEFDGNDLLVCFNDHEKGDKCQYERYSPQRTWVGLTDEEIWQIATDSTIGGDLHADKFAKAIESKLKERNG